jgi:hypothetical protein
VDDNNSPVCALKDKMVMVPEDVTVIV